jgi:kynureninase
LVEIKRREGEHNIRLEDVLEVIRQEGESVALVLIGGVNYYTGQVFDMKTITQVGHEVGAKVGWDLAHAAGNIEMKLHDWQVDFAAWCSYKYMNSGPGNASGCFVHEKHHSDSNLPRFAGWWGHNKERRFKMEPQFDPVQGADGWQISNLPILSLAPYLASVHLFDEVGMPALVAKRDKITSYLEFILAEISREVHGAFEVITPSNPLERASQLSVFLHGEGRRLFDYLMQNGVITDWREPNVIRLAPVPLYTSYEDMYHFGQVLKAGIVAK